MQYEACLRAAQQLSRQLADGKRLTSVCLICLVDFVYKHDVFGHAPRLREDCHELFDSCVQMFMTPRTADDLARLHRRPGNCRRHHARTDLAADDLHMIILETLEIIVSYGLHSGDSAPSARALKTQKAFANSAGHWPTRLDQLLPFDATPAVAWMLDLAEKRLSSAPLAMLANCVTMARGVVLPVMLTERNRTRLAAILCKTLCMGASARAWRKDPRSAAALCIDSLCHGPGFLPRDFDCFVAGHETALYEATCEAVLGAPDSLEHVDALAEGCARLHDMLGARVPRPAPKRVKPLLCPRKKGIVGSVLPHGVRAALAHTLITQAAGAPRCAAPGCGLAVLQSGDCAKFQEGRKEGRKTAWSTNERRVSRAEHLRTLPRPALLFARLPGPRLEGRQPAAPRCVPRALQGRRSVSCLPSRPGVCTHALEARRGRYLECVVDRMSRGVWDGVRVNQRFRRCARPLTVFVEVPAVHVLHFCRVAVSSSLWLSGHSPGPLPDDVVLYSVFLFRGLVFHCSCSIRCIR